MCLVAYEVSCTCLGEKHREVSFAAKDPNRELWRLKECPDLKHTHTQTQKRNASKNVCLFSTAQCTPFSQSTPISE